MPDPFKNVKIIELMELFDDEEVTTADQVDRPERAIERQAIDDFMERNPRADGGRIGFAIGTPPRKIFIEEYKKFKGSDKECANFLNKKFLNIYSDGEQTRSFVYISDVVRAFALSAKSKVKSSFDIGLYKNFLILLLDKMDLRVAVSWIFEKSWSISSAYLSATNFENFITIYTFL